MKKILLFAAVALTAMSVNAQDWNATKSGPLPVGTVLLDNEFVKVTTAVQDTETALIKDETDKNDPKTYAGFTFTKYINIRIDAAPSADNDWLGTAYADANPLGISLVIEAKQNTNITFYYKHGDGKQLSCLDQANGKAMTNAEEAVEGLDGYYTGTIQVLADHKYVLYARGGTTSLNGFSTVATPKAEEITGGTMVKTTWTMNDPEAISETTDVASAVTSAKVTLGKGFTYQGTVSFNDITFTKLQPTAGSEKGSNSLASAKSLDRYIEFQITPNGKYQITKVEFDAIKIGTGDPTVFAEIIGADGKAITIADNLPIRRNNDSDATDVHQTYEATSVVSDQPVAVRIYAGKLADNKQFGIANVTITGNSASATTGIDAVKAEDQQGTVYNLAGQKVSEGFKGLVIKNGKKVIVK